MSGRSAGAFIRSHQPGWDRAFGSRTMSIYVLVILAVFAIPLIVNGIGVALTHPLLASALESLDLLAALSVSGGVIAWLFMAVGEVRGPIAPGRFEATVRLQSPDPRTRSLGPLAWRAFGALVIICGLACLFLGIAGMLNLGWSVTDALLFGAFGLVVGAAAANARLLSQANVPYWSYWVELALILLTVFSYNLGFTRPALLTFLAALALATPWLIPTSLKSLPTATVLKHSARAEVSATMARTGDFTAATREYRQMPNKGRDRRVLPGRFPGIVRSPWGILRSAWRTPARAISGLLLQLLGALVFSIAIALALDSPPWLSSRSPTTFTQPIALDGDLLVVGTIMMVALVLVFIGQGSLTASLEFAAETAASAPIFRLTAPQLMVRTGASFLALVLLLELPMFLLALALAGSGFGIINVYLGVVIVLAVAQVAAAKISESAKGPMPPALTTPIATPAGDASSLIIALWQVESLIWGPVAAGVLMTLSLNNPWWMLLMVAVTVWLLWTTRRRLNH